MGQRLAAFGSLPSHIITTLIGSTTYRVRYTYRPRVQGWYMDLFSSDGEPLAMGRRLSPLSMPIDFEFDGAPDVFVFVSGPDDYSMEDLGKALFVSAFSLEELLEPLPEAP